MSKEQAHWLLIAVLFSTIPLSEALARYLHEVAYDMHKQDIAFSPLAGDNIQGRLTNLRKSAVLGSVVGPAFEAEIDTENGTGSVHFLLTKQGIALREEQERTTQRLQQGQLLN